MWFRSRDRRRVHTPFDASALPRRTFLTVAEAVEEGLMLTEYASRMSIKNSFLIRVLAGQESWDRARGRDVARAALQALAGESDTDADNLDRLIAKLQDDPGSEREVQGYTDDDLPNMEHRRDVSRNLAGRLREQSADEARLDELVDAALRDAWREVAANIERTLDLEHVPVDADYLRHRDLRMRRFVDEDLAALLSGPTEEPAPVDYGAI
jgi:hypothetical protein